MLIRGSSYMARMINTKGVCDQWNALEVGFLSFLKSKIRREASEQIPSKVLSSLLIVIRGQF